MPARLAASAHCVLRCSVGATTTMRSIIRRPSSSLATERAKVVFPAPGVATARKSRGASVKYLVIADCCHARSEVAVPQAARSGQAGGSAWGAAASGGRPPVTRGPCRTGGRGTGVGRAQDVTVRSRVGARAVAAGSVGEPLPDLLAVGADGELGAVPAGDPHLPAQRDHRRAHHHGLGELVLLHVVREAVVVAVVGGDGALVLLHPLVESGAALVAEAEETHAPTLTRQLVELRIGGPRRVPGQLAGLATQDV